MSSSEASELEPPRRQWIPGHCMVKRRAELEEEEEKASVDCPKGYVYRNGHYRNMPSTKATHPFRSTPRYLNRFHRQLRHRVARHPMACPPFQTLEEFQDCSRMVRRSLESYLMKQPTRTQVKQYIDYLVNRVFTCTGRKLQNRCYFHPTTTAKKLLERQVQDLLPL